MDGTLVTRDKVLTPRALAAARSLREAGIELALTSSRPPQGMRMLAEPLGLTTPLFGFNGGVVATPRQEVLETRLIAPETAREIVGFLDGAGVDVWVYTPEAWCVPRRDGPHVDREVFILRFEPEIRPARDADLDRAAKIVGVSDDHERLARAETEAQARFGRETSATRSEAHFLDFTHPEANKGAAAERLAASLGLDLSEVCSLGDMQNDVLMFRKTGWSVAMGNASDAVKSEALWTSADNEHDGWAQAIERLLAEQDGSSPRGAPSPARRD